MKEILEDFKWLIIVSCIALLSALYFSAADENEKNKIGQNRIKTLATECVNICPRGVDSFEIDSGRSICKCRN